MPSSHIWSYRNQSYNHIRKAQHSHPFNQWSEWPSTYTWPCEEPILHAKRLCTYIWLSNDQRKATSLTSDQPMIEERHSTYIWSTNDQRKDQHLYLINQWLKKGLALISDQPMIEERLCTYIQHIWGTNPTSMFEKACTHIWSYKNQSYSHIRMSPGPRLSYLVTDQVPPFSRRMAVSLTSVLLDRMAITHIWHGRN